MEALKLLKKEPMEELLYEKKTYLPILLEIVIDACYQDYIDVVFTFGKGYATIQSLAWYFELSIFTIRNAVKEMAELNLIAVTDDVVRLKRYALMYMRESPSASDRSEATLAKIRKSEALIMLAKLKKYQYFGELSDYVDFEKHLNLEQYKLMNLNSRHIYVAIDGDNLYAFAISHTTLPNKKKIRWYVDVFNRISMIVELYTNYKFVPVFVFICESEIEVQHFREFVRNCLNDSSDAGVTAVNNNIKVFSKNILSVF